MAEKPTFRLTVLGRYPARLRGNAPAVTVNVAAGSGHHPVHAGTLTMAEDEWQAFVEALRAALKDRVEVDDPIGSEGTES